MLQTAKKPSAQLMGGDHHEELYAADQGRWKLQCHINSHTTFSLQTLNTEQDQPLLLIWPLAFGNVG